MIAPEQPDATRNVLAWLRGETPGIPQPPEAAVFADPPPHIPPPGRGLHLEITGDGRIGFAPPDALDAEGNNIRRLRALHPELRDAAAQLCAALGQGNAPPNALQRAAQDYRSVIANDLDGIDFDLLYARGVRLRIAAGRWRDAIARDSEIPLSAEAGTALDTVLDLHGPFIGATRAGQEMLADEEADTTTPEQRRTIAAAAQAFVRALQTVPGVVKPEVTSELAASAAASGSGDNPVRSSLSASNQSREVARTLLAMGAVSGVALGALHAGGPAGAAATAPLINLLGVRPIEASAGYTIIRKFLSDPKQAMGEEGLRQAGAALRRAHLFILRQPGVFDGLVVLDQSASWLRQALDWIRRHPPAR